MPTNTPPALKESERSGRRSWPLAKWLRDKDPSTEQRLAALDFGAILRALGLGRLAALEARPPIIRYERDKPGELIHIDRKKLGRIEGNKSELSASGRLWRTLS